MNFNIYKKTKTKLELPPIQVNSRLEDPKLYIPSEGLENAVNVALALGQPLLITGEPGTGKTRLADHIAWAFGLGDAIIFNAQTTSTAKDLFYKYDALGHFQYSQTSKELLTPEMVQKKFIKYQGLGEAIDRQKRCVVLIDEIDKAPRDLPNDILAALEKLEFTVPEVNDHPITADKSQKPIIIMTSNSEKNLPDAFLRRVIYYHIPFPGDKMLLEILKAKTEGLEDVELNAAIAHFENIRKGRKTKLKKNPATAELLYWILLLQKLKLDCSKLNDLASLSEVEKKNLAISYSVLAKNKEDLDTLKKMI
ncbi:MAG: MoxR-like ATPase [Granulosicoccus sp.]|jgi:MoxR-like ATPase